MKKVVFLMMVVGLVGMILTGCNNHHREEVVVASEKVAAVSEEYASDEYGSEEYASDESEYYLQADKYFDLGLTSGTKWSNTNVKVFYKFEDARDLFGSKMPSKAQWEELRIECEWTWVKGNNPGYRVTGPNGNSIFLPAAGYRGCDGDVYEVSMRGIYWSGTEYLHYTLFHDYEGGYVLRFDSSSVKVGWEGYCGGCSVRFVKD